MTKWSDDGLSYFYMYEQNLWEGKKVHKLEILCHLFKP